MRAVAAYLLVVTALAAACGGRSQAPRPGLQRVLDSLVTGPTRVSPGATAYVAGPHGTWSGAAGLADVAAREAMPPDARMRLESVSKLWTATVVAKLAEERRLGLDDTVERWLPGVFPYGDRITIRELLSHTSGMVDNNDFFQRPAYWLSRIRDATLRAKLRRLAAALQDDPGRPYSIWLEIRAAAAIPLLFDPGTQYRYSNIGYKTLGLIAEKAGRAPLAALYDRVIVRPLGLRSAAYAPSGRIPGLHPVGYLVRPGGRAVAATHWGSGALGAEGGIVADARDEARFLVGLVQGRLLSSRMLTQLETPSAANPTYALGTGVNGTCAGTAYMHNGGGLSWSSSVAVTGDGEQVAVLLLNGRTADNSGDATYAAALLKLFCSA